MPRTDEQELSIRLEAKIADFERNMNRAAKKANAAFGKMDADATKASSRLNETFKRTGVKLGDDLKAGIVAGLSAIAIKETVGRLGDIAKEVANIGSEAKRAGLSSKAFQELGFVARQNRIEVDALTDGLKEMSLRADEFILTGSGSAAQAFQRLGFGATELKTKLKEPSDLFVEIIGRMEKLDRASQIRVADEIFGGTGGEKFVQLLDQGADGINTLKKQANSLGLVMSDELIAKADELDRKFGALTDTVSTGLKRAVVEAADALDQFIDQFKTVQDRSTDAIKARLEFEMRARDAAQANMGRYGGVFDGANQKTVDLANKNIAALQAELASREKLNTGINGTGKASDDTAPKVQSLSDKVSGMAGAGSTGAKGLNSFADAVRALKGEIPGLASQLAELDGKTRIDAAYKAALSKASSIGDTLTAEKLHNEALSALSVKTATGDSQKYLSGKLAAGRPASYITDMQSGFAENLAKMMASAPEAIRAATTITSGARSVAKQAQLFDAAVKKYGSVQAARKWAAPPGKSHHNAGDAADLGFATPQAKSWFHDNASQYGLTFPMAYEDWHIEDASARRKSDDSAAMEKFNASETERNKQVQKAKDQATTYAQIIAQSKQFTADQGMERQALTMTAEAAAKLRAEHDLLNQVQQAGIAITPEVRQQISTLAGQMASAETSVQQFAQSQQDAQAVAAEWQNVASGALKGFVSDLLAGKSAGEAFQNVLAKIADKLVDMAVNSLFENAFPTGGGKSGGGGGGLGGIFGVIGKLFGFKDGGVIPGYATGGKISGPGGPRDDKILARLSAGEFVTNARSTAKHRALLEMINADRLPAFANGGLTAPSPISTPTFGATGSRGGSAPIAITSNVNVNANGGDPKQNEDLAEQTRKAVDAQMRVVVAQELRKQTRPGGAFGR